MINVTKTFLPPREEYATYLDEIWERGWVTNHGPLLQKLERELKEYLGVKHLFLVSNGTIALQVAIKALGLKGEIITTPFSYVATTSSIVWEGCSPVFVDINQDTLCLNPDL
ncbi:MAG: DegT/DnrJ/EryC1/StrS family aminotransferase, partial [Candidatus Paceibacterota bacterium]